MAQILPKSLEKQDEILIVLLNKEPNFCQALAAGSYPLNHCTDGFNLSTSHGALPSLSFMANI